MKPNKFLRGGGIYMIGTFLVMGFNYGFHALTTRTLSPQEYGVLSGLFALFALGAFTSQAFQMKAAELNARLLATDQKAVLFSHQHQWIKRTFFQSALIVLILLALAPLFSNFFHTEPLILWLFFPVFIFTFTLSVIRGFLQGKQDFVALSGSFVLESSTKCLLALAAWFLGFSLPFIILTLTLSQIPSFLWGRTLLLHPEKKSTPPPKNIPIIPKMMPFGRLLLYFAILALWFNMDMILVQNLRPDVSGAYSVASKLGQIILFAGMSIGQIGFPKLVENFERKEAQSSVHFWAFSTITGITLLGTALLHLFRDIWVAFFSGQGYEIGADWIWYFGILGGLISLIHYLVQWHLAEHQSWFLPFLALGNAGMFLHFSLSLSQGIPHALQVLIFWSLALMGLLLLKSRKSQKKFAEVKKCS